MHKKIMNAKFRKWYLLGFLTPIPWGYIWLHNMFKDSEEDNSFTVLYSMTLTCVLSFMWVAGINQVAKDIQYYQQTEIHQTK